MYNFERLMKKIAIVNGPNLNLVGKREPAIYGNQSMDDFISSLQTTFPQMELTYFQSNIEGELIDFLQQQDGLQQGIILNAGGYTHTSVALADAVVAIGTPVIEVHISHPPAREVFRQKSILAPFCIGTISGLGLKSYVYAIQYFLEK
jgi:3-dehydroquinate dehydratase-2